MLAVKCEGCGANAPVALASPDEVVCVICGHHGSPDGPLSVRIAAAAEALGNIGRQQRQLSRAQRRSIRAGKLWIVAFGVLLANLATPVLFAGFLYVLIVVALGGRFNPALTAVLCAPLLAVSFGALVGMVSLVRRRRKLLRACTAVPPVREGEPALCRVCGGPVEIAGQIARCEYCGADNLVDPALMRRFGQREMADLGSLQRHVEAEARQLHQTGAWASVMLLLMVFAAPVFALVWALIASVGLRAIELPADRSIHYALEDWCFVDGRGDLTADDLPGRYLQYRYAYDVAVVEKVYRDPVFNVNYVKARAGDEVRREPVQGLCLAADGSMHLAHDQSRQQDWLEFDGEWVWFLVGDRKQGGALRRVSIEGGEVQEILRVGEHPLDAAVDQSGLPWVVTYRGAYGRDGAAVLRGTMAEVEAGPAGVYACGKDGDGHGIWRLDGGVRRVTSPAESPEFCTLDGGTLYYLERLGFAVDREFGFGALVALDLSTGERTVLSPAEKPKDRSPMHVFDGWLYWIEDDGVVERVKAGQAVETVDLGPYEKKDLLLQGDSWFWLTGAGVNTRIAAGTGEGAILLPPATSPSRIDGDAEWLVWNEPYLDGRITRRRRGGITTR